MIRLLKLLAAEKLDISAASKAIVAEAINDLPLALTIAAETLAQLATTLGAQKAVDHSHKNGRSAASRIKHIHTWFDGFKTLKFIHLLREHYLNEISYQQWCQQFGQHPVAQSPLLKKLQQLIDRD